jgi:GNAT superfamily N-acetyltransferase/RimJ/RimL family protein N-acetyltransferase
VEIDEVDARTASDDVLARFYEIERVCHEEVDSRQPFRTRDEAIAFHRFLPETTTIGHWLAEDGCAVLWMHGPTATFCEVLVLPDSRRQGLGAALLDRVVERCRELGVETVRGEHMMPAGAAFSARAGAVDGQRIVRSLLDLRAAELPEPVVPDGFRLVSWLARTPAEHLDAYVRARGAMDDAPAPDDMDYPTETAERVRAMEASCARRNREMRVTVAMDDAGDIGAFTDLRATPGSVLGFTDDTGTVAAHRGKGLARAVKIESLRWLRADHPEIEVVTTRNAEENAAMRHINESVGFRPTVIETTAALAIRPS